MPASDGGSDENANPAVAEGAKAWAISEVIGRTLHRLEGVFDGGPSRAIRAGRRNNLGGTGVGGISHLPPRRPLTPECPMRLGLLLMIALVAATPSSPGVALGFDSPSISTSCCDPPVRWMPRHDSRDARKAITTESGEAMVVLTDRVVAIQLSDRTIHKMKREFRKERQEDDNVIASAIKNAVMSTVETFLDRSAEVSVRDLKDVSYRDGRLVFTTEKDGEIFQKIDVNDEPMMRRFSDVDARAFVQEFRRVKAKTR